MKKIIIVIFFLEIFFSVSIDAQNIFYFYFAPSASIDSAFGAANTSTFLEDSAGVPLNVLPGYHYVQVTASNRAIFNTIASPNLRRTIDSLMSNNSVLRIKVNRILALSGNKVNPLSMILVDDRTGITNPTGFFSTRVTNGIATAWSSTDNWVDPVTHAYIGRVRLGEQAANLRVTQPATGGWRRWESTIMHEITHTQFMLDTINMNKWGPEGVSISYGGDVGHWPEELMADEQMALNEGFCSFWGLDHHPPLVTSLVNFLNDTSARFRLGSHSFLTGTARMWNSPHQVEYSGPSSGAAAAGFRVISTSGNYELRRYKWLDVPGDFVLYNEQMAQAYFYLYHLFAYANRDTALNKIISAMMRIAKPNQRLCYPATAANDLANSMEADARRRPNDTTMVSSMFAYALYDLLQHFGKTDSLLARDFRVQFATYVPDIPEPRAYNAYFTRRNAVKQLICPFISGNNTCSPLNATTNIIGAVQALRNYFHNPAMILR